MHSHLWGFRSLKSIYSSVLHHRGPDSGIQQKMATHSISNPTSFSSHMSNYHIWSHTLTVLSQSPPSSLSFSVRLSICTFTMLFLQPACLSILSLNDIFTSKKSHFFMKTVQIYYIHTHTHTQSKSVTMSSNCPYYGSLHYYNLLFLLPSLPHWLHPPIWKYISFEGKAHVFNILMFSITANLLYEWWHENIFEHYLGQTQDIL